MVRSVTVTREYGAGGGIIAQRVAEMLGWHLLDRDLIGAVASAAEVDAETIGRYDEHVDSWWHRFHLGGLRAMAIVAGVSATDAVVIDAETVARFAKPVIAMAAWRGNCVIVGRGAQCVLQSREDVFHVYVYGPWAERVARVRERIGSAEGVEESIRLTDQERASYIRTYYGFDWQDPHLYDLMISSKSGVENTACMIVDAVRGTSRARRRVAGF